MILRLFLCFFLCGLISSVKASNDIGWVRYNYWPIFFYQKYLNKNLWELELLGPFYYQYFTPDESSISFRPFISFTKHREKKEAFFLSPLGHYFHDNIISRFRLVPFFSKDSVYKNGKRVSSNHNYFLFFWGTTKDEKKYGGFFPFYGTLRNWGFRDEVTFFLWPLYVHSKYSGNDSYTILWPFFNKTYGESVYQFKFWPLYGHRIEKNLYDRRFFLWPFFWYETFRVSARDTGKKWMFFPFFAIEKSPLHCKYIFLWPFFKYYHYKDPKLVGWEFPWPFLRYLKGPYDQELSLWPLIGFKETISPLTKDSCQRKFYFWPLYISDKCIIFDRQGLPLKFTSRHRVLVFSKYETIKDNKNRIKYQYLKIWPIMANIQKADGFKLFYFPALLPFDDEGLFRNYGPFLRIYEHIQDNKGFSSTKALWGLYRHDKCQNEEILDISFIFTYHRKKEAIEVSFLKGLFAIGNSKNNYRLRLFYLKIF